MSRQLRPRVLLTSKWLSRPLDFICIYFGVYRSVEASLESPQDFIGDCWDNLPRLRICILDVYVHRIFWALLKVGACAASGRAGPEIARASTWMRNILAKV